ncbi:protein of unknown function [Pseudarcicella hirudinis]|uniref:2-oxoadipate dioxygenase/decarboxylase n=1 Tax=Pseudarcicella hirudinis TaxID=1079859 RepID=A0A1I5S446_9BACT|nr:DUF1338 domain-containing protein [Pseudarcicella hirudinis]SFP65469.1 protein of unknown function [Pseudarcicella hirudinis]
MQTQEEITRKLLEKLWENYCQRVSYARKYAEIVHAKGGNVVNDHCAFRTFNTRIGNQKAGITAIAEVLLALGYQKVAPYAFPSKHLNSFHYQHPANINFPKFFVTQLEVENLSEEAQQLINEAVKDAPDLLAGEPRLLLEELKSAGKLEDDKAAILTEALVNFFSRPWKPAKRETILAVNKESQFAAWTLLHGNSVNHFTAYINHQNIPEWADIEQTMEGLKAAGIPVKSHIEGEKGSKLRQSSTQAVDEDCPVTENDGSTGKLNWSYAYYELAERNFIRHEGKEIWFDGFLGEQATNLFEMTKR